MTRSRVVTAVSLLGTLLTTAALAMGCSSEAPADDEEGDDQNLHESALTATYTDGTSTYRYVDTHDQYKNTGVIDKSKFLYFHKVGGKQAVGLTQDCAWVEPANANEILDVLKANDARITFFISGPFIFEYPRRSVEGGLVRKNLPVIKRMIEEGHEFGSHTQNHPHNNQTIDWVMENKELVRGWDAVLKAIYPNSDPPKNAQLKNYWRAPYGEYDARSLGLGAEAGFPFHFGWNVDVKDAVGYADCKDQPTDKNCLSPQKMTDTVLGFAEKNHWSLDGFVILSHLQNPYHWGARAEGLDRLIKTVYSKGHVIAKISEMFVEEPAAAPDPGQPPPSPQQVEPRLGATCASGCIFSGMCVAQNANAHRYQTSDGQDVVCVKSGDCNTACDSTARQ